MSAGWTAGSPCPFAALGLGLDTPPIPIAATLELLSGDWSVTFNRPLQPGSLDSGNWTFRASGQLFITPTATAAGPVVSGTATAGLPDLGPDVVNYAPPPFDVISVTGLPAAAFLDFPLVVT